MEMRKKIEYYPSSIISIEKEDGQINDLKKKSNRVDGDNQKAVWMNKRHSIEYPKHTIQGCCNIRIRLEFLYRFLLNNFVKCWSA